MLQINASIVRHNEKILCAYRTKHLHHYNSECFLTELNADLEPIAEKRLTPENHNSAFEDIRLFSYKKKLLAFYNYFPFQDNIGWKREYSIGFGEVDLETGLIKNQKSLRKLGKKLQEQHWVPFEYKKELFMITDFEPFLRVIKIETETNEASLEQEFISSTLTTGWNFGPITGGTPLISSPDKKDNWLYGFVHSFLSDHKGYRRCYYYTVIRYDHSNKKFEYHPVPHPYNDSEIDDEYDKLWRDSNGKFIKGVFPAGLMSYDDGVVASFGKDEVESYTEYFSWNQIKGFFNDVI